MNAYFYNLAKRENSTKIPSSSPSPVNILLKDGCSILRPSISVHWPGGASPTYNYCRIASPFSRNYWIDNWTYNAGEWIADMHVDVLGTYKTEIGNAEKYILRSASKENKNVIDNKYPMRGDYTARARLWGTLTDGGGNVWSPYGQGGGRYVVTVIGKGNQNTTTNNITQYQMSGPSVQTLIDNSMDAFTGAYNTLTANDAAEAIMNIIRLPMRFTSDLSQYIKNVMWFPFSFPSGGAKNLNLGVFPSLQLPDTVGSPLAFHSGSIDVSGIPDADGRLWEYSAPYATYTFTLDPFGTITLDPADIIHSSAITYTVHTDSMSGLGILRVFASNGLDESRLIAERTAQIGVSVPYGGVAPNYAGAISGIAGIVAAANSESILGDSLMFNAIGNAISGSGYNGYSAGTSGGGCSVVGTPVIDVRVMNHVDIDPDELGYPLCEIATISTLSGFVQVNDGELAISTATPEELAQLKQLLEGGFFYE